jgi:hypothetical protein
MRSGTRGMRLVAIPSFVAESGQIAHLGSGAREINGGIERVATIGQTKTIVCPARQLDHAFADRENGCSSCDHVLCASGRVVLHVWRSINRAFGFQTASDFGGLPCPGLQHLRPRMTHFYDTHSPALALSGKCVTFGVVAAPSLAKLECSFKSTT